MDWLIKMLTGRLLIWLLAAAGNALVAHFEPEKWKHWKHLSRAQYILSGVICIVVIGYAWLERPEPPSDESNIATRINQWSASIGYRIEPMLIPDAFFAYRVTLPDSEHLQMIVGRTKEKPPYLQIAMVMDISPEHRATLSRIPRPDARSILLETQKELLRKDYTFSYIGGEQDLAETQSILIIKSVPISGLTESEYTADVDEVKFSMRLVRNDLKVQLQRAEH